MNHANNYQPTMPLLIDVRKLSVINGLIKEGAESVADSFGTLSGVKTTVDIKSISFLEADDMATEIGSGQTYSARIRLTDPPYGVFMLTFSPRTAINIAEQLTGTSCDDGIEDIHQSAIRETCNIMTSGFIDGIANNLDRTIDMGTPTIDCLDGQNLAATAFSHVRSDATAVVLDSNISTAATDQSFNLQVYLVPDPGSFVTVLDSMSAEPAKTVTTTT
jgi:chemotaxis protein CheC